MACVVRICVRANRIAFSWEHDDYPSRMNARSVRIAERRRTRGVDFAGCARADQCIGRDQRYASGAGRNARQLCIMCVRCIGDIGLLNFLSYAIAMTRGTLSMYLLCLHVICKTQVRNLCKVCRTLALLVFHAFYQIQTSERNLCNLCSTRAIEGFVSNPDFWSPKCI